MKDLFGSNPERVSTALAPGAMHLPGFVQYEEAALLAHIERISRQAPFRHLATPGGGRMSVASTNCGDVGWYSDAQGYRYERVDPSTERPWPRMPVLFLDLAVAAAKAAGYEGFAPQGCLINQYEPGARMGLHQDRDENRVDAPVVSLSIGAAAIFSFGGATKGDPTMRVRLEGGDAVVWGGPSRLFFHGVGAPRSAGFGDGVRYNLTFRAVRERR